MWNMIIDDDMILCSKDDMYLSWLPILLSSILTGLLCVSLPLIFGCPLCAKSLANLGVSELPDRLVSQTFKIAEAAYYSI